MRRILAALMALIQITGSVAQVQAEATFWSERRAVSTPSVLRSPLLPPLLSPRAAITADIPLKNGTVRETHAGGSQNVFIIQDIHLNYEAQRNIAAILQNLIDKKSIDLVAVEGAFEKFDFSEFRAYKNKARSQDVADYFLEQGKIGAPSYVGVTSQSDIPPFVGIDDPKSYEANVNAYLDSRSVRPAAQKALSDYGRELIASSKAAFSAPLRGFDRWVSAYESGQIGAAAYVRYGLTQGWRSEQINAFMLACRLESSLDMKRVESERAVALGRLAGVLSADERNHLIRQTQLYEEGSIPYATLYSHLETLFVRHSISIEKMPMLRSYLRYVAASDRVDGEALLSDIAHFTASTYDRLAVTPDEKYLVRELVWVRLAQKLINFSLTPAEWETYKHERQPHWVSLLRPFELFYVHAELRSQAMVNNIVALGEKRSALITGGFHAPHIKALLKNRGLSYTLVSPKLTAVEKNDGVSYLSVFTQEKSPIESVVSGASLFINPASIQLGTPEGPNQTFGLLPEAIDEALDTGVDARVKGNNWTATVGRRPQSGETIFNHDVRTSNGLVRVYAAVKKTLLARIKEFFSPKPRRRYTLQKSLRLQPLETRTMKSGTDLSSDPNEFLSQISDITPGLDNLLSPYAAVAPVVPGKTAQANEKPTNAAVDDAVAVLFKEPEVLTAPVLAMDAAFDQMFLVDSGEQATPVTATPSATFDPTTVSTLLSPDQLHVDEQGNAPILNIRLQPSVYFNTEAPVAEGYNVTREETPYGSITRVQLHSDDVIVVSLVPLADVKTDALEERPLTPLQVQGTGEPAPAQYKTTIRVGDLPVNEFGEISLRLAVPMTEQELSDIANGSVALTISAYDRSADGTLVAKGFPGAVIGANPIDVDPSAQPAVVMIQPLGPDNAPNAPAFERQTTPPSKTFFPFFLSPQTPTALLPPSRQSGSSGGGTIFIGGGGGGSVGGEPVNYDTASKAIHFVRGSVSKPVPLTLYPLDLHPMFEELKNLLSSNKIEDAVSETDEIVRIDFSAVVGRGNFLSFKLKNISESQVEYWVIFMKGDQVVVQGPFTYQRDGDNPMFNVPEEYQNAEIYLVVKDHGTKDGNTVVIPERIEVPNKVPEQSPRVLKRASQNNADVETPSPSEEAAPVEISETNKQGALIAVVPAALVLVRDVVEKRLEQVRAVMRRRPAPQKTTTPLKGEPAPKTNTQSLDQVVPLAPLYEVSKFGKALAAEPGEIMSERQWVYVPSSRSRTELLREINGRLRTIRSLNGNSHIEIFLTSANAEFAGLLRERFQNEKGRVMVRVPADYEDVTKMRELLNANRRHVGNIKFLIRRGAVLEQSFLNNLSLLSKEEGFDNNRISVFLILETTLRGDVGRISLDSLLDPRLYKLLRSQA